MLFIPCFLLACSASMITVGAKFANFIGPSCFQCSRPCNKQNYNFMSTKHRAGYMPWDRTGNRILVQSELGKNKPSNYDIPEENFVYGKLIDQDPEKANDLMYNWSYHQLSQNKNAGKIKDLLETNKAALKSFIHTSSGNSAFRKTQTLYKPAREGSTQLKIRLPEENFTYGKPGDLQDPIKLVIANDYGETDKAFRHTAYQMLSTKGEAEKRKLSCYITKNHSLVKDATNKRMALFDWARRDNLKQQWKLSKFSGVHGKVDTNRKRFASLAQNTQEKGGHAPEIEAQ